MPQETSAYLNLLVLQQPEAYIGGAAELFGEDCTVTNADLDKFLTAPAAGRAGS
ncbi:MAG TPA: hypothetical protein VMF03_01540 [Steroidobacteraceae bacterium]|nr:hypothetical protein [Steroidobacteraceae bacterium]